MQLGAGSAAERSRGERVREGPPQTNFAKIHSLAGANRSRIGERMQSRGALRGARIPGRFAARFMERSLAQPESDRGR